MPVNSLLSSFLVLQARLNQEIARQGFLPFSKILSSSRPFNAPMGGLVVHFIPSLLVITLPPSKDIYSFILNVEGYPAQFFSIALSIGVIWLRFKRPDLKRPYKAWIPGIAIKLLLSLTLLASPFFPPSTASNKSRIFQAAYAFVGIGIIIFAVIYWYIWTIVIPKWKGYTLEEAEAVLDDGTTITKLIHVDKS